MRAPWTQQPGTWNAVAVPCRPEADRYGGPVQFIVVAPAELVVDPPDTVIVRDFVPQLALLSYLQAVVCHGGHNTVVETLAQDLPLVIAPIRTDP